jgi:nitrate reductase gamma subunit
MDLNMDGAQIIQIVCGVLAVIVLIILIQRRRTQVK